MLIMFPLRLFAVYFQFSPDFRAEVTPLLSVILTSFIFPTRSCQIYLNHIDQKNTAASNISSFR